MNKSLQDQLLKAGLINTKKAKQISKDNRKATKEKIRKKDKSPSEGQAAVQEAQKKKQVRDKELNLKLKREADKKALIAQVGQLIDHYKLKRDSGDVEYSFTVENKVKKIRVTSQMADEITRGRLCISRRGDVHDVIQKPIADKILERDTECIVVYNTKSEAGASSLESSDADDDYYAQFEIPDDLTW